MARNLYTWLLKRWIKWTVPASAWAKLYSRYTRWHPSLDEIAVVKERGQWRVDNDVFDEPKYVPTSRAVHRFRSSNRTYSNDVFDRYTASDFVEIKPGDTVVDVGAFVGQFSMAASDVADRVVAIEPDDRSRECLRRNVSHLDNVEAHGDALWHESTTVEFLICDDPIESSIVNVDFGAIESREKKETTTLGDFARSNDIETIDLLKVDAEGAEPEILRGLDDVPIRQAVIDTTAERNGQKPTGDIVELLEERGHTVRVENDIVFSSVRR